MPTIPDVLLGLTSVAAVGYVGKKALTGPAVISEVTPRQTEVGETVTLVTSGIVQQGDDMSLTSARPQHASSGWGKAPLGLDGDSELARPHWGVPLRLHPAIAAQPVRFSAEADPRAG